MGGDFQYNHSKNQVFVRYPYTNFPWVPFEDLGEDITIFDFAQKNTLLDDILYEMCGIIDTSDINADILQQVASGPIGSGRKFVMECKRTTELLPEDPENWWNYGVSLRLARRIDQAIEAFKKAAELTPSNPRIWRILGETYLVNNETSKSMDVFKTAVENIENTMDTFTLKKEKSVYENIISTLGEKNDLSQYLNKAILMINKKIGWKG